MKDIEFYVLDLSIMMDSRVPQSPMLMPKPGPLVALDPCIGSGTIGGSKVFQAKRDCKDIIIVASSAGSYMFSLFNGIPVKEFVGDKLDMSLFSLTRYLKRMKDCKDVRMRIKDDFFQRSRLEGSGMLSGVSR